MMRTFFLIACVTLCQLTGCAVPPPPASSVVENTAAVTPVTTAETAPAAKAAPQRIRATGTAEDARRHMVRGMAAIEMAKSEAELALAEAEFLAATDIAPQMANAWFNLAKTQTQLGRFEAAIDSYRHYLQLAPTASDAVGVQDEITKLEFRQELLAKTTARVGQWVGRSDAAIYNLTLNGNRVDLKTTTRMVPKEQVSEYNSISGSYPVRETSEDYQLQLQGDQVTGVWSRVAIPVNVCTVPPDSSAASGQFIDSERKLVLRHEATTYVARIGMAVFSLASSYCAGVDAGSRVMAEETLYGPLAKGGLDVLLVGLTRWWDGGFSSVQYGWQGRLAVNPDKNSTAYAAGLREEDEILAIDGVPVNRLSAGEAVMRLRGEPGTKVTLEIWRDGGKPFFLTVPRVAL